MEIWKEIEECPGYEVSNLGYVRSWRSKNGVGKAKTPRLIKQIAKTGGYLSVGMSMPEKVIWRTVHVLVATAFHGKRPFGLLFCHKDGNKANNVAENLRWDTDESNRQDQLTHGTRCKGDNHYRHRMDKETVIRIKKRLTDGESVNSISKSVEMSPSAISAIKNGKSWKNI